MLPTRCSVCWEVVERPTPKVVGWSTRKVSVICPRCAFSRQPIRAPQEEEIAQVPKEKKTLETVRIPVQKLQAFAQERTFKDRCEEFGMVVLVILIAITLAAVAINSWKTALGIHP